MVPPHSTTYSRCCNSNGVSIMAAFIKMPCLNCELHCLYFEISDMHLVSYHILMNYVNTKWPDLFCNLPSVYQYINYVLHVHRNASIARNSGICFLSDLLQNNMILAELLMIEPWKLMVGHRPQQQAQVWLQLCIMQTILLYAHGYCSTMKPLGKSPKKEIRPLKVFDHVVYIK